ncbi:MAG: hypothetical protein HOL31_01945 [Candidatus Scalindua sp.]|nr:hypothetical protein [Candidatus Scalindua sp.]
MDEEQPLSSYEDWSKKVRALFVKNFPEMWKDEARGGNYTPNKNINQGFNNKIATNVIGDYSYD